jgi:hypothetical protein
VLPYYFRGSDIERFLAHSVLVCNIYKQYQLTEMTNHQFSKQEVITLLAQLGKLRVEYPPDLIAAQRRLYLGWVAQVVATRVDVNARRNHWASSILHEPSSTVIKVLIVVFVAFLLAFVAHAIAIGSVNFEWLIELLSR